MQKIHKFLVPAILLIAALIYFPQILHLDYVWDDNNLFLSSDGLRDPSRWLEAIVKPIIPGTTYFRPFALLTFAIEFWIFGVNPKISHIINISIHTANTIFLLLLMRKVFSVLEIKKNTIAPLIAALIYLAHPALVESSIWVAGRFDLLVTFFSIACIYFFLSTTGISRIALVTTSFALGTFSKEMIFTMPAIILVIDHFLLKEHGKLRTSPNTIIICALMCVFTILYAIIKSAYIPNIVHVDDSLIKSYDGDVLKYISYIGCTIIFYVKMAVFPFFSINPYHKLLPKEMGIIEISAGMISLIFFIIFSITSIIKQSKKCCFFVLFLISLLPVLHIIPLTIAGSIGQDRFLTFPLVLLIIGCTALLAESSTPKGLAISIALLYLAGSIIITKTTIPFWKDNLSLWTWVDIKNAKDPAAKASLAFAMLKNGMPEMAINKADEAYAQSGNQEIDEGLHLRLSVIKAQAYIDAGQYNQAIAILNKYLLENNYQVLKDIEATRENYRSVYHAFFSALGEATLHLGHFEESKKYIDIALNFDKNGFYAIYLKSLATFSLGDEPGSEILFNEARDRYPPSYRATLEKMRSDYKKMLCSNGELSHLKKESWHCKD